MSDKDEAVFRPAWPALAVAGLSAAAFLPALFNGFAWDDELNFLGNAAYRGLGWAHVRWAFTTAYLGPYQPLSWLSSGLDYSLWGMNPAGYHAVNLLLHAANAALVFFLARRLLRLAAPGPERGGEDELVLCAAAAALLFAVHPLRVEAVAWATERRTVLAGLFYFSALWLYLESRLAAAAVLFALSLLSKGIGIGLPVTLLALDYYPLRRLNRSSARAVLREKIPFFLIAAAFGAVELLAYSRQFPASGAFDPLARATAACFAPVFYLVKTAAPFGLSPFYGPALPLPLCAAAVAAAITWFVWRERERRPFAFAAWVHYVAALAPVLGLIKFGEHAVADRYSYLACAGWPVLAAGWLWSLRRRRRDFEKAMAATAVIIVGLGLLTWRQTRVWHDSVRLWSYARTLEPDSAFVRKSLGHSYYNAGNGYLQRGRPREAERFYLASLELDPDNALAHNNLGVLQLRYGTPEQAAACFCRALRVNPAEAGVVTNLRAVAAKYPRLVGGLDPVCRGALTTPE